MQKINELHLAKELIRFPSVTPVDAGVMKFLEKKLKKLGFKTKIIEFKEKGFKSVKNLYARLGTKEPNLCYAGHLDVVPPGNIKDWTTNPFYVPTQSKDWSHPDNQIPRRAGVSAFGFGGTNFHVTMEAYVEGRPTPDDSSFLTIVDSL